MYINFNKFVKCINEAKEEEFSEFKFDEIDMETKYYSISFPNGEISDVVMITLPKGKFDDFIEGLKKQNIKVKKSTRKEFLKSQDEILKKAKKTNEELKLDIPQPTNLEFDVQYLSLTFPDGIKEIIMMNMSDSEIVNLIDNLHDNKIKVEKSDRQNFLQHQKNRFIEHAKRSTGLN